MTTALPSVCSSHDVAVSIYPSTLGTSPCPYRLQIFERQKLSALAKLGESLSIYSSHQIVLPITLLYPLKYDGMTLHCLLSLLHCDVLPPRRFLTVL